MVTRWHVQMGPESQRNSGNNYTSCKTTQPKQGCTVIQKNTHADTVFTRGRFMPPHSTAYSSANYLLLFWQVFPPGDSSKCGHVCHQGSWPHCPGGTARNDDSITFSSAPSHTWLLFTAEMLLVRGERSAECSVCSGSECFLRKYFEQRFQIRFLSWLRRIGTITMWLLDMWLWVRAGQGSHCFKGSCGISRCLQLLYILGGS